VKQRHGPYDILMGRGIIPHRFLVGEIPIYPTAVPLNSERRRRSLEIIMQPFHPHRTIPSRNRTEVTARTAGQLGISENAPTFSDIFGEIGIVILVCLGLSLMAEVIVKMSGIG
jgi:hypothetical protein